MTRILIADDHELILEGLKKTLGEVASDIVGANSFDTAVAALNGNAFDFCVIDHELNPGRGDKLLEKVRETMPQAKAICISGEFSAAVLSSLTDAGFNGFYSKSDDLEEMIAAVESLETDEIFYSTSVQELLREASDLPRLSARQLELLEHIKAGRSNKDAAHLMGVRQATVSFHMRHLKTKLRASNAREIIARAQEFGF